MTEIWGVWKLNVFLKAYELSLEIHPVSHHFPKSEQYSGIADQIRRSSKSVCALMVEGNGRQKSSDKEFRRYLIMAVGSVEESKLWSKYACDLGYITAEQSNDWIERYAEIARMLNGLINRL